MSNNVHIRTAIKARVIKRRDVPEFTEQEMRRREIDYMKALMCRHKDQAKRFAEEIIQLTNHTVKV